MSSQPHATEFWNYLRLFWSTDRVNLWMKDTFKDEQPYESCKNLITLSPDVHSAWQKALFALKPISISPDEKRLDIQLFWMPRYQHPRLIDPRRAPELMASLNSTGEWKLFDYESEKLIRSGHLITMETDDPDKKPLPSFHLLDMQWTLQCLTNMSAAGEREDSPLSDDYDDEDDSDYSTYWEEREIEISSEEHLP